MNAEIPESDVKTNQKINEVLEKAFQPMHHLHPYYRWLANEQSKNVAVDGPISDDSFVNDLVKALDTVDSVHTAIEPEEDVPETASDSVATDVEPENQGGPLKNPVFINYQYEPPTLEELFPVFLNPADITWNYRMSSFGNTYGRNDPFARVAPEEEEVDPSFYEESEGDVSDEEVSDEDVSGDSDVDAWSEEVSGDDVSLVNDAPEVMTDSVRTAIEPEEDSMSDSVNTAIEPEEEDVSIIIEDTLESMTDSVNTAIEPEDEDVDEDDISIVSSTATAVENQDVESSLGSDISYLNEDLESSDDDVPATEMVQSTYVDAAEQLSTEPEVAQPMVSEIEVEHVVDAPEGHQDEVPAQKPCIIS
ncbi:hypothetical protein L5515_002160 [Caenorhabditis briggsae]|uniref:Uncharacterized protein n=1 Tax=Caenorhabditis briggsae TaxID=6238 RepID=A0AAE9E7M6_CAEBR|nr:hypothetical protein L5515_002160 [Caenorhabditis briggsae]